MVALSYLSAIRFSGLEAGDFLHNQLSADIKSLTDGQSTLACYCEPKGRVLALMLVSRQADDFIVIMAKSLVDSIAKRLQMYVIRAKVVIEVLSESTVTGLHADETITAGLTALAVCPVPDGTDTLAIISTEDLPAADSANQDIANQEAWKHAELQRGICWLDTDTSGEFLPQMLGFDAIGAVNYKKGCYPGQEIVARTHYLGKVKRHPRLLCSQALIGPNKMDKLSITGEEKSFDAVTVDYAFSETLGNCLLVVTRMEPDLKALQMDYQGQTVKVDC